MTTLTETRARPQSTVRHTRAIQRDRRHRPTVAPPDPALAPRLTELIHPATLAQVHAYHALGLRERTLTLPIMMAFILSLIWRQVGTVQETVRLLQREGLLWTAPMRIKLSGPRFWGRDAIPLLGFSQARYRRGLLGRQQAGVLQ